MNADVSVSLTCFYFRLVYNEVEQSNKAISLMFFYDDYVVKNIISRDACVPGGFASKRYHLFVLGEPPFPIDNHSCQKHFN